MKVVYYPCDIEGAEDIHGWVNRKQTAYDLKIGGYLQMSDDIVDQFIAVFPFLKVYKSVKEMEAFNPVVKKSEVITKPKKKTKKLKVK